MERNTDFNNFANYDNMSFNPNMVNDAFYQDPMFNPIVQYEQAYMYYRYLSQQMDYKIKCKEYDRLCGNKEQKERRIEWNSSFFLAFLLYIKKFYKII